MKSRLLRKENNYLLWWLLLGTITAFLFMPALNIKFWWIDDGRSIFVAQKLISSITSFNFQDLSFVLLEQGGRFRIIYWMYQTLVYVIGGTNPLIHFIIHFLIILVTSIYIFEIVRNISKFNLAGFFAGALYILTPINTENLYRLGPIEPVLTLFIVASLYYLIKDRIGLAVLFLLFTIFAKETGFVIWLPILGAYLLKRIIYKIRDLNFEKFCFWGFIFFSLVVINTTFRRFGYSTNYVLNPERMISNFGSYIDIITKGFAPLLGLFILTAIFRFFSSVRLKKIKKDGPDFIEEAIFLILPLLFLVVLSPWEFVLDRYLMPATAGLVIFLGVELAMINRLISTYHLNIRRIAGLMLISYFAVMFGGNAIRIYRQGERVAYTTNFIQELFFYLSESVPKDGVVLYNFLKGDSTWELVVETDIHLDLFYNRSDIEVSYLDLDNLSEKQHLIVGTPMIREQYSRELVEKSINNYKKGESIVYEKKFLIVTTPFNLVKQTIKKVAQFVVYRKPITPDGIYTYYISRDYWYKYRVEN
jgi:hypothetical protein